MLDASACVFIRGICAYAISTEISCAGPSGEQSSGLDLSFTKSYMHHFYYEARDKITSTICGYGIGAHD